MSTLSDLASTLEGQATSSNTVSPGASAGAAAVLTQVVSMIQSRPGGLSQAQIEQHLSTLLPQIVDHLTPNGQVPQGDLGNALAGIAERFLHART
jgi:uncharacterized protein YidB (DUF937 family)